MSKSLVEYGIDGRVAIVTGAGSGIGRETSIQLAKMGAKVALVGRRLETVSGVEKEIKEFMLDIAKQCNDMILAHSQKAEHHMTMGTTLVMIIVRGNTAHIVHAGDSRVYLLQKNGIRQITQDHSIVQELLDSGKITIEQAYNHPNKNIITSALGVDIETRLDYNELKQLAKGDILVACSDGLSNMLKDNEIMAIIRENDFYKCADRLIENAVKAGGYDNVTAVVLSS